MAYNSLHTAFEAAVNALLAVNMCGEIDLVMSPSYQADSRGVSSAVFNLKCVKSISSTGTPMSITFQQPTQREDGSVLMCNDITGYELVFDGKCVTGHTVTADGKSKPVTACVGGE